MQNRKLCAMKRQTQGDKILNMLLTVVFSMFILLVLYPIIFVISSSFSSGSAVTAGKVFLWPVEPTLNGYELVLRNKSVFIGFRNSVFYTFAGTLINMVFTILCAYPLSREDFQGKRFFSIYFLIPMFFSGGLVPEYILMSKLKLNNTVGVVLLGGALNIYNMILMRTYFKTSIPKDLLEAARLDGISDFGYLRQIVLPLSKPILGVVALYYAVGHWNSYFTEMIYLHDRELYSLQLVLRDILNQSAVNLSEITDGAVLAQMIGASDLMKYSMVVISVLPILIVYPFVSKYFEKGVMIGAIKG